MPQSPLSRRAFLGLGVASLAGGEVLARSAGASPGSRSAVPVPVSALVTGWDRDRWALGSYSALPPGVSPSVRATIAQAIVGGRIAIAGEFASTTDPGTATGAYLSGRFAAERLLTRLSPRTAIVVGAGFAGAAGAELLAAAGVRVTVLEASNRVGGRVYDAALHGGGQVELGAAWIHGLRGNPLVTLARSAGLVLIGTDYNDAVVRDIVTGRVSSAAEAAWGQVERRVAPLERGEGAATQSVGGWLRTRYGAPDRFTRWAEQVEIVQEYGLDADRLGVRAYAEGRDYRGGDAFVAGGYARIAQLLLGDVQVQLRTPVSAITASRRGVEVASTSGRRFTADAVVVAVPLALLKAGRPLVTGMSPALTRALRALRTGNLEKVALEFDEQWWGQRRVIGVVGGGTAAAPPLSAAALRWTEFYSVSDVVGRPVLVGLAGGSAATSRPRSAGACVAEAMSALRAAYRY